jgi:hypothetical protein
MNIQLPDHTIERLSHRKINNLVIDLFQNGRQTHCYSNSPSEWQNFASKNYRPNGFANVFIVTSEDDIHSHLTEDTIVLLYDKTFKAVFWLENSIIKEYSLSKSADRSLSGIIKNDIAVISQCEIIDKISAICGLPFVTNPAKKYLLNSKLNVLDWDFLPLDRTTKQFFKYRNDHVNVKTNITVLFQKQNAVAAITLGSQENNTHVLKLLNDMELLFILKHIVFNGIFTSE